MGYLIFCTDSSHCSVPTVTILYQCTEFSFMPDFYKINPIPVFSTVNIEELASFYPVQMHNIKSLSTKFIISLRNLPILFSSSNKSLLSASDQNTRAEEENEKNDFYNAVQSLSSITDETTRTQLAEILVKKEMKKKSGI